MRKELSSSIYKAGAEYFNELVIKSEKKTSHEQCSEQNEFTVCNPDYKCT
jgi:hypothetical protein